MFSHFVTPFSLYIILYFFPGYFFPTFLSSFYLTEENKEHLEERNEALQKLQLMALCNDENSAK